MGIFKDNPKLLKAFRKGNDQALSQIYEYYVRDVAKLLRFGFSFSSQGQSCRFAGFQSAFDLNDALQETFLRAFSDTARLGYDGQRPYSAYLMQIARNHVINLFRHREDADDKVFEKIEAQGVQNLQTSQEDQLVSSELAQLYQQFIKELPEIEQQVLRQRFEKELARRKVCEQCGLSPMQLRTTEKHIKKKYLSFLIANGYPIQAPIEGES
jgi:RNA polymerase sigma-70 factor (ECF subfamily)